MTLRQLGPCCLVHSLVHSFALALLTDAVSCGRCGALQGSGAVLWECLRMVDASLTVVADMSVWSMDARALAGDVLGVRDSGPQKRGLFGAIFLLCSLHCGLGRALNDWMSSIFLDPTWDWAYVVAFSFFSVLQGSTRNNDTVLWHAGHLEDADRQARNIQSACSQTVMCYIAQLCSQLVKWRIVPEFLELITHILMPSVSTHHWTFYILGHAQTAM